MRLSREALRLMARDLFGENVRKTELKEALDQVEMVAKGFEQASKIGLADFKPPPTKSRADVDE